MEDCTRCGTYRPDFRFPITHLRHKTWSHAAARRAAPGRWSRPPRAKNPPRNFLQIGAQPRTTWTRTTVKLPAFPPRHSFLIAEKPLFGACFGYRPHPPSMENKEHWTQPGCRNPLDFRRLGIPPLAPSRTSHSAGSGPGGRAGTATAARRCAGRARRTRRVRSDLTPDRYRVLQQYVQC